MKPYQASPKKAIDSQPSALSLWPFVVVEPSMRRSELIEPTAERRKNKSGMLARCWRAVLRDALNERAQ